MRHFKRLRHRVTFLGIASVVLFIAASSAGAESIQIRKHYIDLSGGQLHYVTAGDGEAILLLHQAPLSHAEYLDVIPILAEHFKVIAWDAPGHGNSYIPPQEYEFPEYINVLHELVTALSLERVHLAGVHSGAAFAKEYAATHPERAGKIILGGFGIDPPEPKMERKKAKEFLSQPYSRELELTRDGSFLPPSWKRYVTLAGDGADLEHVLRPFIIGLDARTKPYDLHLAVFRYDKWSDPSKLQSPTLLVYGVDDFFVNQERLEYAQSLIPNCEIHPGLEGAGSFIAIQRPKEFAEAITNFLKKGSASKDK